MTSSGKENSTRKMVVNKYVNGMKSPLGDLNTYLLTRGAAQDEITYFNFFPIPHHLVSRLILENLVDIRLLLNTINILKYGEGLPYI